MSKENQKGFTLVSFAFGLVALLLAVLIGLLLFRPVVMVRQYMTNPSGLHMIPSYTRACVLSDSAWAATVADPENKSMECLRKHTECDTTAIKPPFSYIKLKASLAPTDHCFLNYNTMPGVNADGLTKDGNTCTGFKSSGNEQCPYRMNVYWIAECPGGAKACRNPIVRVHGDMYGSAKSQADGVDLKRYSVRTVRSRTDQMKYFVLTETLPAGQLPLSAPCKLTGSPRVFTNWIDTGGYVDLKKDGSIVLEPGTYSCNISVPGYRVGNFKAMLVDMTKKTARPLLIGTSEYSPVVNNYAQTRSELVGAFRLQEKSTLALLQFCSSTSDQADERLRSMGVPMRAHPQWEEIYSIMQCWVL